MTTEMDSRHKFAIDSFLSHKQEIYQARSKFNIATSFFDNRVLVTKPKISVKITLWEKNTLKTRMV